VRGERVVDLLQLGRWSPYVVGAGIGILSCLAFLLSDRAIGCSTAYARTSGMLARLLGSKGIDEKAYYRLFPPLIDWEWMLVAGVVAGAFLSAKLSGQFRFSWIPPLWETAFGASPLLRWLAALSGGIVMGFGARWAGGCTSGHGISGTLQLALSSWVAAACFFIGGVATAMLLFRALCI
jgi:uncharacterized protein